MRFSECLRRRNEGKHHPTRRSLIGSGGAGVGSGGTPDRQNPLPPLVTTWHSGVRSGMAYSPPEPPHTEEEAVASAAERHERTSDGQVETLQLEAMAADAATTRRVRLKPPCRLAKLD